MDDTIIAIKAPHEGAFNGSVKDVNQISFSKDMLGALSQLNVDASQDLENTLVLESSEKVPLVVPKVMNWDEAGLQPNDIPGVILDSYGGTKEKILKITPDISKGIKSLNVVFSDTLGLAVDFTITFTEDLKGGQSRTYAAVHAGGKTLVGFAASTSTVMALTGAISAGLSTKHIPNTKLGLVTKALISTGGAVSGAMIANGADESLEQIAETLTAQAENAGGNMSIRMDVINPQNRQQKGLVNIVPNGDGTVQAQTVDGVVNVRAHTRDGHKVQAHTRGRPDGDASNNLATQ